MLTFFRIFRCFSFLFLSKAIDDMK